MPITLRLLIAMSLLGLAACDSLQQAAGVTSESAQDKSGLEMARQMRKNGNAEGAKSIYRELLNKEKPPIGAYIGLASLSRKSGKPDEALAVMREAQKQAPADEKVLLHLGYTLIAAGQYQEAVNVFDMLTAINHGSAAGYNGKAVAFDHAGNHVAAQEIYQKALSLEPGSLTIQNNLALSLILNDQWDSAISLLEPLANQTNASPTLRQNLALAYGLKGDTDKAHGINLKDVSPRQADENLKFYSHYSQMRHQQQVRALSEKMQPVLPDPNEELPAAPPPAPVKPAVKTEAPAPQAPENPAPEAETPKEKAATFMGYRSEPSYPTTGKR